MSALAFTAHPQRAPFPEGDVVLLDANGHVSDILRFDPETIPGPDRPANLLLFNDHGGRLADTGLPSPMFSNTVIIRENPSGPTIYTPGPGQPGSSTIRSGELPHILDTGYRLDALDDRRRHCGARVSPLENASGVTSAHAESG